MAEDCYSVATGHPVLSFVGAVSGTAGEVWLSTAPYGFVVTQEARLHQNVSLLPTS